MLFCTYKASSPHLLPSCCVKVIPGRLRLLNKIFEFHTSSLCIILLASDVYLFIFLLCLFKMQLHNIRCRMGSIPRPLRRGLPRQGAFLLWLSMSQFREARSQSCLEHPNVTRMEGAAYILSTSPTSRGPLAMVATASGRVGVVRLLGVPQLPSLPPKA